MRGAAVVLVLTLTLCVDATHDPYGWCNVTLHPEGGSFQTQVQGLLDGVVDSDPFVVCLNGTHKGCGTGVSLATAGGGPVVLRGLTSNATVDCEGSGRVALISSAPSDVYVHSLIIRNGAPADTGAFAKITASDVYVTDVTVAECVDRGIDGDYTNLYLTNTSFVGNSVAGDGAGVHLLYSELSASGTISFTSNSADYGAGIYCEHTLAHVDRLVLKGNSATWYAMWYIDSGSTNVTIKYATVEDNVADGQAGIYFTHYDTWHSTLSDEVFLVVEDGEFRRNVIADTHEYGAVIFVEFAVTALVKGVFEANIGATKEGGIVGGYWRSHVNASGSVFVDNVASEGTFFLYDETQGLCDDCVFVNNEGDSSFYAGIEYENRYYIRNVTSIGNGIVVEDAPSVTLVDTIVVDATATYYEGGGVYFNVDDDIQVIRCVLLRNYVEDVGAGGGAYFGVTSTLSGTLTVLDSVFDSNTVVGNGASGLYMYAYDANMKGCTFTSNEGAPALAFAYAPYVTLVNCVFRNHTFSHGASIEVTESLALNLVGCTVSDSSASGVGGGLWVSSFTTVHAINSSFVANTATVGGAIFGGANSLVVLEGCWLDNNRASGAGGGLFALLAYSVSVSDTFCNESTVYVLFADAVWVDRVSAVATHGTQSTLQLRGVGFVALNNSTLLHSGSQYALVVSGVPEAHVRDALVALPSGSTFAPLSCSSSVVEFTDSVVCGGAAVSCAGGCSYTGQFTTCAELGGGVADGGGSGSDCYATAAAAGFCGRQQLGPDASTAPNYGAPACGGSCAVGSDSCVANSTKCYDSTVDPPVSYDCVCRTGFATPAGTSCSDVNECVAGTNTCGGGLSTCVNTFGSFSCDCPAGYAYDYGSVECVDVDECAGGGGGSGPVCGDHATCTNTVGSYSCTCGAGSYVYGGVPLCRPCGPGRYLSGTACAACPANTYSNGTNVASCTACPNNAVSPAGSAGCSCLGPLVLDAASGECVADCVLGEQRVGLTVCLPCAVGSYGDVPGTCTLCPPAHTTVAAGADSADDCVCVSGTAPVGPGGSCVVVCPPGQAREVDGGGPGVDVCASCADGEYKSSWGPRTNCSACPSLGSGTGGPGAGVSVANCSCPPGRAPELVDSVSVCATTCPPGSARPSPMDDCELCGRGSYSSQVNSGSCTRCPANTDSGPGSTDRSACVCKSGFYNGDGARGAPCDRCPEGARCSGSVNQPVPLAGYADVDGVIVECSPRAACKGGGDCAEGHSGERCAECKPGWHRVSGYCRPCGAAATVSTVLGFVAAALLCAVIVAVNLRGGANGVGATLPSVAIGVGALQMAAQVGRLAIAWPDYIQRLMDVLAAFSFSVELVAPECSVPAGDPFAVRYVAAMATPFVFAAMLGAGYIITRLVGTTVGSGLAAARGALVRAYAQSAVQLGLFLYLPLSSAALEFFDCVPVGDTGTRVVASSPEVVCGGELWRSLRPLAVVAVLLYPIAFPVSLAGFVFFGWRNLTDVIFHVRFDFLVNNYRSELYFYEAVVLVRKMGVALCVTLVAASPYVQAGASVCWLLGCVVVHVLAKPYDKVHHNWLESVCVLLVVLVLQEAVMFQDAVLTDAVKGAVMLATLLALLVAVVVGVCDDVRVLRGAGQLTRKERAVFVRRTATMATEEEFDAVKDVGEVGVFGQGHTVGEATSEGSSRPASVDPSYVDVDTVVAANPVYVTEDGLATATSSVSSDATMMPSVLGGVGSV